MNNHSFQHLSLFVCSIVKLVNSWLLEENLLRCNIVHNIDYPSTFPLIFIFESQNHVIIDENDIKWQPYWIYANLISWKNDGN